MSKPVNGYRFMFVKQCGREVLHIEHEDDAEKFKAEFGIGHGVLIQEFTLHTEWVPQPGADACEPLKIVVALEHLQDSAAGETDLMTPLEQLLLRMWQEGRKSARK